MPPTSSCGPSRGCAWRACSRPQGQYDKALATLGTADMGRHQSAYLEARGDVLLAKGDQQGALAAYEAARKLLPESQAAVSGVGELLDLKISDLRAAAAQRRPAHRPPHAAAKP